MLHQFIGQCIKDCINLQVKFAKKQTLCLLSLLSRAIYTLFKLKKLTDPLVNEKSKTEILLGCCSKRYESFKLLS